MQQQEDRRIARARLPVEDGQTLDLDRSIKHRLSHDTFLRVRHGQTPTSKISSSSTHAPTGRLAMPRTRRVDALSAPNTLTSNSDAASATLGCSRKSGVVTSETPRRTTRVTLSSEPKCSLA